MIERIPNLFNQYELKARIFPALITIAPFGVTILIWYPELISLESSFIIGFILVITLFFLAKIARERGKIIQHRLLKEWGGFPSTIFLKHSDNSINENTKARYHDFLNKNINNLQLPTEEEEIVNPYAYEDQYNTAVQWLLEKTRDNARYSLLYQDNINYGFSRNMMGIKQVGIFLCVLSLAIDLFGIYQRYQISILDMPLKVFISIFISLFFLSLWLIFVRKKWVRSTSEAYARTLLSSCEQVN